MKEKTWNEIQNNIGKDFGALTLLECQREQTGITMVKCRCVCGKEKEISYSDLKLGRVTSCGCRANLRKKRITNLVGQQRGYLTVLRLAEERYDFKNKRNMWECRCVCGQLCYKSTQDLNRTKDISCGCIKSQKIAYRNLKNEIGKTFGKLKVVDIGFDPKDGKLKNICQCECGNIIYVYGRELRNENTQSCGCRSGWTSLTVKKINDFLSEKSFNYRNEYTFPDLLSDKGRPLRYDIAILNKNNEVIGLIEYNGEQHYTPIEYFGGEEGYEIRTKHDKKKQYYAMVNNIPLLIFKYTDSLDFIKQEIIKTWRDLGNVNEAN